MEVFSIRLSIKPRAYIVSMKSLELESVIKCPECEFEKEETMPTDSCQFFYECTNCKALLKPKTGDCCVFCSYASVNCPSKQQ